MRVLSLFSGIGAPEYAWRNLPFTFVGQSEIDPFASAVLDHHYPAVQNFGDINNYEKWELPATPSLIVGGSPCQPFSIANGGLQRGLADPRGNLALVFLAVIQRYSPEWLLFENVPGILSSGGKGRDFGTFLSALGELGYWWAYRLLDSRYHGVWQRRKRLYLIGHRRKWQYPAAVLFDRESCSGDIAQSKRAGKNTASLAESSTGATMYENHPNDSRIKVTDIGPTVTRRWGSGGGNTPLILQDGKVRRILAVEAEKMMGFAPGYSAIQYPKDKIASDSRRFMALGNSMCVPLITHLAKRIMTVNEIDRSL